MGVTLYLPKDIAESKRKIVVARKAERLAANGLNGLRIK
jgi:hypothetical protein